VLKSILATAALACAFVAALSGCGGAGTNASVAQAKFSANLGTLDSVAAFLNAQTVSGRKGLANALLAYLKQNPKFVNPGISADGTVYATLPDGTPFSIATNDPTLDLPSGPAPSLKQAINPGTRKLHPLLQGGELPGGGEAFVIDALPATCESPASTVASELKAAGYHVTSSGGLLSDWQSVSNAAVLFNSSHGAQVPDPKTGDLVFWQQTGQEPVKSDEAWAVPLIKSGALLIDEIPIPTVPLSQGGAYRFTWAKRYDISAKFLTSPSMFAANSLFWDECCSGASAPGQAFVASLQQHSGLHLFAGWTNPVVIIDGNETSSFFFDRALGVGQFPPVDLVDPEPNDWSSILGIMQSTNRASLPSVLLSTSNPSRFASQPNAPDALLSFIGGTGQLSTIIPSISTITQNTTTKVLTLNGSFGTAQGTVNLGSTALTVTGWTPTVITAQLPDKEGDLQVVSPYGTLSNTYAFQPAIIVAITPPGATMQANDQKTFSVAATSGNIPDGASYRWTLSGNGTLAGGSPQVTKSTSVSYTAPSSDSSDSLKVEVLNAAGATVATATALISVGSASIVYTVTGDVTNEFIPNFVDGTFTLPFFQAFHYTFHGHDNGLIEYGAKSFNTSFTVVLTIAQGAKLYTGEMFTYQTNTPEGFHFLPGTQNSSYLFNARSGSLTVTSVKDNGDGTFTIGFTGSATDTFGCQVQATGSFLFHYTYDTGPVKRTIP